MAERAQQRIARIDGLDICGKTGTAQNPHGKDHSIFIAFAPKDDPKLQLPYMLKMQVLSYGRHPLQALL